MSIAMARKGCRVNHYADKAVMLTAWLVTARI